MRTVFFGSPEFAVPALEALNADAAFEVSLVVTQGARGASPVERAAEGLGLPVYKPATLRDAVSRQPLVDADADLFVVAAFGLIFRQRTLDIPRLGSINIHPSLLPKYRGASPIMAAVSNGDAETGVSLMVVDAGIDTGPVVSTERVAVAEDDTTETLGARLARVAAAQVVRDVPRWARGELAAAQQEAEDASLTRPLAKADGLIDWREPATAIERQVRAMWPWPRAWTTVDGAPVQVHRSRVVADGGEAESPGEVTPSRKRIVVACGIGLLEVLDVEPAGRRPMSASAYLNGRRPPLVRMGAPDDAPERPPLVQAVAEATSGDGAKNVHCG